MISKPQTKKLIRIALVNVQKEISGMASHDSLYARGLASEGYAGGYADCLRDMELLLNGIIPDRDRYWYNIDRKKYERN